MVSIKPLMSLVDTLHLGLYVHDFKLTAEDYARLDEAKKRSRERIARGPEEVFEFKGKYFRVTSASKHYAWVLINDDISVKIARTISGHFPEIFIEFRSRLLLAGLKDAYIGVMEWVEKWADIKSEKVSRADLAVDFEGLIDIEMEKIVMRPRKSIEHSEGFSVYREGRKITGYTFGSGDLLLRIYNKTEEIKKSRKQYIHDEWGKSGWDRQSVVWRVEGQLRRSVLKEFQVETVQDLIDQAPDIWHYITGKWFTVRQPTVEDQTRSRWLMSEMWSVVHQSFKNFGILTGVVRDRIKAVCIDNIVPQMAGLLTSFAALMKKESIDYKEVFNRVRVYYGRQQKDVQEIIDSKMKRYALFEETICYD